MRRSVPIEEADPKCAQGGNGEIPGEDRNGWPNEDERQDPSTPQPVQFLNDIIKDPIQDRHASHPPDNRDEGDDPTGRMAVAQKQKSLIKNEERDHRDACRNDDTTYKRNDPCPQRLAFQLFDFECSHEPLLVKNKAG